MLEPVHLAGTTVSRATLHNQDFINEKGIAIGDVVTVRKAGDIIPEVLCVNAHNSDKIYEFPKICPSCSSPVVKENDEAAIRCINPDCPAQLLRNLPSALIRRFCQQLFQYQSALSVFPREDI